MSRKEKPLSAGPSLSSSSPTRFINRVKDSTGVSAVPIRSTSWPLWGRTSSGALWIPHRLATRTSDEPSAKSLDSESSRTASCLAASSAKPCPAAQHRVFQHGLSFPSRPQPFVNNPRLPNCGRYKIFRCSRLHWPHAGINRSFWELAGQSRVAALAEDSNRRWHNHHSSSNTAATDARHSR